ncbi:hypothetical protein N7539_006834 [Penicillium diatomitis]|uniref:Oxidoreductase-like domain-containing protein n=1 Tax=Penicillium diatomitis TaxID=2819901 RepID=A0A9W9X2B1_9EURO|nr:uncharacterized protein N7539_006834 [Penicillium diatomitis]KAJ5480940.1 hypothetical protein N7539_006834 [Penicillium diatomitis]
MKRFATGGCTFTRAVALDSNLEYIWSLRVAVRRHHAFTATSRRMRTHDQSEIQGSIESPTNASSTSQAHSLGGYYSLLLKSPLPVDRTAPQLSQSSTNTVPASASTAEAPKAQTPQEKMAIVFGTRLAGPGRQSRYNPGEAPPQSMWKTINGVPIPPQPEEPENCCMSGCVHCVWDDFRDEMEEWAARIAKAKAKASPEADTEDARTAPRAEVNSASLSMDDDGGGSETNWTVPNPEDDLFANIPVGIREFMKTEKKLRVKHQKEAST